MGDYVARDSMWAVADRYVAAVAVAQTVTQTRLELAIVAGYCFLASRFATSSTKWVFWHTVWHLAAAVCVYVPK
jgi:hypothetical protein